MPLRRTMVVVVAWLCCLLAAGAQTPQASGPHVSVALVVPPSALAQGATAWGVLDFKLDPGWHVYWKNAGDSGEPPQVKWSLPAGVTADPILFPTPKRLPLGPLMDFGYEHEVAFPVLLHVRRDAKTGPGVVGAQLAWLVCREQCIPGKAQLSVARPVVAAGAPVTVDQGAARAVDAARAALPKALAAVPGATAVFASVGKQLTLAVQTGKPESEAVFFPEDQDVLANAAAQPARKLAHGVALTLTPDENATAAPAALKGVVVFPGGRSYAVDARPGTIPAAAAVSTVAAGGLLRAVGLAFAGGLVLNLMPCVFPVLFLKGLALVESSREERGRMRAHGWVYALGILVSFWLLLTVLLALRAAGGQQGWGFQFQSPVPLALMAMFLFFLALSLAGMFEIGLSLTSAGSGLAAKGGFAGSFFTGVLATVVATPCTAPFMGAAIGFALGASALVSFGVFTALALGLACPYLLLSYNPGWTRLLPKPGAWMEVLKQATAVPVFATVIWLVWLFAGLAGVDALMGLLAGFLLLAVAGWVLGRWPGRWVASGWAVVVLIAAVALPVAAVRMFGAEPAAQAPGAKGSAAWVAFTPGVVEKLQAQGKPVLVDFTANWCLSCQVNERVVLDRSDVQQHLRDSGVALVRADWTRHDGDITEALAALGRSGIPAYALYPAQPGAAPQLLPEVLTPGIVFSALDSVRAPAARSVGQ